MITIQRFSASLSLLLGVLLTASALSAQAATVTLSFNNAPSGITVTNGTLVPVNVVAATNDAPVMVAVSLNFRTWASLCTNAWNVITTNAAGTNFTFTIPRLPAGNVDYYASCTYVDGVATTTVQTATNTYTVGGVLPSTRNQDFEGGNWTTNPPYSDNNWSSPDGWTGTLMRVGLNSVLRNPAINPSANGAWLRNGTNGLGQTSFIRSPLLPEGAGTLYFDAAIRNTSASYTNHFTAQIIASNGTTTNNLQSFTLTGSAILSQQPVTVNTRTSLYVRLVRTNELNDPQANNNSALVLDNILIVPPPADLLISQPANAVTPQYALPTDAVTIRCNLQDADTNQMTVNRRVTLYYNFVTNTGTASGWTSLGMTNVPAVSGQYAATLPALGMGTNFFYYRCDFDGYYYTNSDKRGPYYLSNAGQTSTNSMPTNSAFQYAVSSSYNRTIRLQPQTDFAFGTCATNDTRTRTLQVCNDGNLPLTVNNISFVGSEYFASPTNFVVLINGTQNVTVVFAPNVTGPANDTLHVLSDKTSGTDTYAVSGIGMPVETVSQPTVTGPTGGAVGQTLSFGLSSAATDNWGYVVQNSFDWGDNTTSAWDTASSTTHVWSSAGTYYVRARGRSSTNVNIVSAWSAPVPVAISNTIVMGLLGNLNFDVVGVNTAFTNQLTITNSGNLSLNVANITSSDPNFSVSPTNFTVPAYGASSVNVVFAPTTVNTFLSLITVVSPNMTSGVNTTNATGSSEQVNISLSAPSQGGTLNQQLVFTAAANNPAAPSESFKYRFNWGDGSPLTAWTNATVSNAWATTGIFYVAAQAQSTNHPNVFSAWSANLPVTITNISKISLLNGPLNFGNVPVNAFSNLTITVTNIGNSTLHVQGISFSNSSYFAATPSVFTMTPNGSQVVSVKFTPLAVIPYSDTLVVASDALSGTNTMAVSGSGEAIGQPTLVPTNAAGTLGQFLTFTASASDTAGNPLDYLFDWGNGANSGWVTTNSLSNAWWAVSNYYVRAQARSHLNTNGGVSVWSSNAAVNITNTYIMAMVPNPLSLGGAMINQSVTSTLAISNSGNGYFTVTNVVCTSLYFSVSGFTTNITIQPSNSYPVTVTFAPTVLGPFSGTITAFSTNIMSGGTSAVTTAAVNGYCETLSPPILTTPAGHVNDAVDLGAYSTNNNSADSTNQYRYVWGDSVQTSGWATVVTHVYTNTGTYPVLAQARSATYTNVVSLWSPTNSVNIYLAPIFSFSQTTNGLPFQVTATITGAAPNTVSNCVFYFQPQGSVATNGQPTNMVFIGSNNWTATLPPLNSGVMSYYLQYWRSNVSLRYPAVNVNSFSITNVLGIGRQVGFQEGAWTTNGTPGVTNDFNWWTGPSGWFGTMAKVGSLGNYASSFSDPTGNGMWLRNGTNTLGQYAYIMSPLISGGVGTIYFEVGMRFGGWSAGLEVDVSTDSTNWTSYYGTTVSSLAGSSTGVLHPAITVNLRQPAWVRIRRTTYDSSDVIGNSAVVLDNLTISPPPTDVQITESLRNPGYPNSKDPVRVRCQVADAANADGTVSFPSANRRLTVCYNYNGTSQWNTASMSPANANTYTYEGVIPTYPQGFMTYYFKCDFDGYYYSNNVITNTVFPSENLSPAYSPDQRTPPVLARYPVPSGANSPMIPTYNITFFRSEDAAMSFHQISPTNQSTPMTLVGDYTWQVLKSIDGITSQTWYFEGAGHYDNDATNFDAAIESWGGGSRQANPYPPMSGSAYSTTTDALRAQTTYSGALVYFFTHNSVINNSDVTTYTTNFIVKRAAYQDFDSWQADQNRFVASLGLYGSADYLNDFESWGTNLWPALEWSTENFSSETLNIDRTDWFSTRSKWAFKQAMAIAERGATPNIALQLDQSVNAPGAVRKTTTPCTKGIHNFSFRARLAQNDGNYAVYLGNTNSTPAWTGGYRVTNSIRAISMSPGSASVSLLLCYSHDNPDLGNYYEVRLSQVTDTTIGLQLNRWNGGVLTKTVATASSTSLQALTDASPLFIDITWASTGTNVTFNGTVTRPGTTIFTISAADADANRLANGGTVGFLCADAEPEISALGVLNGATPIPMTSYNATPSTPWYFGPPSTPVWTINGAGNLTRSPAPSQLILSAYRTGTGTTGTLPDPEIWTNLATYTVSSYGYTTNTPSLNYWDKTFVKLQSATNNPMQVVVDDLTLDPWRADTRGSVSSNFSYEAQDSGGVFFWDWTDPSSQLQYSQQTANQPYDQSQWLIFEGWVTRSNNNTYATLDRSRANTNYDRSQGIWSPLLINGLGFISFQAFSSSGTSVFRVEETSPDDASQWSWLPGQTYTNTPASGVTNIYAPISMLKTQMRSTPPYGRIRVVLLPASSPNAVLNLDNLEVRDYPPADSLTWQAYNCLIARPTTANNTYDKTFESPITYPTHQTCFMNNSPTSNVGPLGAVLNADNSYIQTPQMSKGIGQIKFWCRAWDSTHAAHLSILAAPTTNGPWTNVLTTLTVSSTTYSNFDSGTAIFDTDDQYVRFYTQTNTPASNNMGRLCIDNVLVAEPMRPSFDILRVMLQPVQPLFSDQVGVAATIGNKSMFPSGIRVFLSYHVGTNVWGYQNWRGTGTNWAPTATTIELFTNGTPNLDPNLTTYASGSGCIPMQGIDTVVQYVVWGVYSNIMGHPFFQDTNAFVNPPWYAPVDLNLTYTNGWSPYYFAYSCPPGSVWVNEINYPVWFESEWTNEYIELIGPANANLGKWKLELFDGNAADGLPLTTNCFIANNFVLPNTYSNWGFFVWGDAGVPNVNQVFDQPGSYDLQIANVPTPNGAVRLTRSMGAVEDAVCWGASQDGFFRTQNDKFWLGILAPIALQGGPIGGGTNQYDFVWAQPSSGNYTPGLPNTDQHLGVAPVIPKDLFFTITTVIGAHGRASCLTSIQILANTSTSIVYTADDWYRISALTVSGAHVFDAEAGNVKVYTQAINNVSASISNAASFYLPASISNNGTNIPTSWLTNWPEAPFYNNKLSLGQEYLLNINPFVSNDVSFVMDYIGVTGTAVSVTVKLLECTDGVSYNPQQTINGTLSVQGASNLASGVWAPVSSTAPGLIFDGAGNKTFTFQDTTNRFYRANIQ